VSLEVDSLTRWWPLVSSRIKYSPTLPSVYQLFLNSSKKNSHCPSLSCVIFFTRC